MIDTDQIVEFLGKGFSQTQVAQICGCTVSYICQVAAEKAEDIAVAKAIVTLQKQTIDQGYNDLEEAVLERLRAVLPFETNTTVLLRALATLNGAKRRSEPDTAGQQNPSTVVNQAILVMPTRFIQEKEVGEGMVVNSNNEIVEIEGRPLINASSSAINNMLNQQLLQARMQQHQLDLASVARGPVAEDF